MNMRVCLVSPGRTSSGGSAFTKNLLPELERRVDGQVTHAAMPPVGRWQVPAGSDPTHVVFLGTRAERISGAKIVFWPLNVAPLERHVVNLARSTVRNKVRHRILKHRLANSVGAADAFIFGSMHARTLYMSQFDRAARKPYLVSHGGAPSLPRDVERKVGDAGPPQILAVSHLYPYKGILEMVEALTAVRAQLPPGLKVRVAGADRDARYARAVRSAIVDGRLEDVVTVAPAEPDEMQRLYESADIAVFPSTCENAGSFALFDGLHAGVPTICSDRSSMPEMARGAAVLVNPFDGGRFGDAIVDLLGRTDRRVDLAARARQWSATAPTWAHRADELVTFLEDQGR